MEITVKLELPEKFFEALELIKGLKNDTAESTEAVKKACGETAELCKSESPAPEEEVKSNTADVCTPKDLNDLYSKLSEKASDKKAFRDSVASILKAHGAKIFRELKPEDLPAVMKEMRAL